MKHEFKCKVLENDFTIGEKYKEKQMKKIKDKLKEINLI
jgi:hypothetical protein